MGSQEPARVVGALVTVWIGRIVTRLCMGEVWDYQVSVGDHLLRCRSSAFERFATDQGSSREPCRTGA